MPLINTNRYSKFIKIILCLILFNSCGIKEEEVKDETYVDSEGQCTQKTIEDLNDISDETESLIKYIKDLHHTILQMKKNKARSYLEKIKSRLSTYNGLSCSYTSSSSYEKMTININEDFLIKSYNYIQNFLNKSQHINEICSYQIKESIKQYEKEISRLEDGSLTPLENEWLIDQRLNKLESILADQSYQEENCLVFSNNNDRYPLDFQPYYFPTMYLERQRVLNQYKKLIDDIKKNAE